ncbi:MAG TPA: hypothetical protein VF241_05410 [Propionibacteriaceae bacterium]
MGLGIARRIVVERHGGKISIDSRPRETIFARRASGSSLGAEVIAISGDRPGHLPDPHHRRWRLQLVSR